MPTTEQLVKKITVGSDSRFIGAKYDYNGELIEVSKLATKDELTSLSASINTDFTTKKDIIEVINQQLETGKKINLEKNQGIVRKMTFIEKLSTSNLPDNTNKNNHFIIYFVGTAVDNEKDKLIFTFNSTTRELNKDQYATGSKIEILNNTAIITDGYGNPTVIRAPENEFGSIGFTQVPEGTISLIYFEEPVEANGFLETEQPQGSE